MKITAKMIADELGVSTATVDRVLNNRNGVSRKMSFKVKEKAKELNYKPNKSASFLSRKKEVSVAFIFPSYPNYFWKEIEIGINQTLEDIYDYGMNIEIIKSDHDIEKQIDLVQQIIKSKNYDAIVCAPIDAAPFIHLINQAVKQGIPMYTFNNDSPFSNRLAYVGADYFDSGHLAGELLHQFTSSSRRFTLIMDEMHTFQMQQKIKGFKTFMYENENLWSAHPLKINHNHLDMSIARLKDDIEKADGIYVACGALAEVAKGIQQMELKKRPTIIGHDISQDIHSFLQNNIVTATICQDPVHQGRVAARTVFNHLMLEEDIESVENIVKLEIVTKGNAKYYVNS